MPFTRYAIYYAPPADAPWVRFATKWLGWDMQAGQTRDHPQVAGIPLPLLLPEITRAPRKYGLHGTLKPPFRLATGVAQGDLETACANLGPALTPLPIGPLRLTRMGRFLALCPPESAGLSALAAACVRELDPMRAAMSQQEMNRRRNASLSPSQQANLTEWGYPYVMDDFRFHVTLTGRLAKPALDAVLTLLEQELAPLLPQNPMLTDLALTGQDQDGRFHLLQRFALSG